MRQSTVEQYCFHVAKALFFPLYWIPSCLRTLSLKYTYISLNGSNFVLIATVSVLIS